MAGQEDEDTRKKGKMALKQFFFILVASEGLYYSLHIYMLYNDNQLHDIHT